MTSIRVEIRDVFVHLVQNTGNANTRDVQIVRVFLRRESGPHKNIRARKAESADSRIFSRLAEVQRTRFQFFSFDAYTKYVWRSLNAESYDIVPRGLRAEFSSGCVGTHAKNVLTSENVTEFFSKKN